MYAMSNSALLSTGCIAFLGVASFFLSCSDPEIRTEDKMVFSAFFTGACVCLGLSTCFHTFLCHSEWAGQLFSKLDYVGIALLIMGSFVPWLYYSAVEEVGNEVRVVLQPETSLTRPEN